MDHVKNEPSSGVARSPLNRHVTVATSLMVTGWTISLTFLACSSPRHGSPEEPIRGKPFDSVFVALRDFSLEEPPGDPIADIRHFRPISDGDRFLVIDRNRDEVRVHDWEGPLVEILGRRGDGPGELKSPAQGLMDAEGNLYIAQWSEPRVTRFGPDLAFDTLFRVPALAVSHIEPINSNLVLRIHVEGEQEKFMLISEEGEVLRRFHTAHPLLWKVPYWVSAFGEELAVATDRVYVANEFLYPLYMYDSEGNLIRTFGTAPESWVEPSRPERGAFVGVQGSRKAFEWLRSFTKIRHVGVYRDSLLIVTHARYAPAPGQFHRTMDVGLDVYDLDGNKLFEDVPPPGKVLRAQDYLYLLLAEPPEGWRIGVYKFRG